LAVFAAAQSGTLAFDFLAYRQAAERILAGQPLYDPAIQQTGGFGFFYYPPPFVLAILPFAGLDPTLASWVWLGLSVAMLLGGIALLPVRTSVRWATLLLAGLSWPVAYALKLGQVGPLLFLLFALGWRWLDVPARVGVVGAIGALVKLQPGIVLGWALLTRRWTAVVVGAVVLVIAAVIATVAFGGLGIWTDFVTVLRNVSDPITTPHNFTPGAVAFQAGVSPGVAAAIQVVSTLLVAGAVLASALLLRSDASYLVAVVASQLLSPILWDHYAMLLLLPVGWLLQRRQWWAALIPLSTSAVVLVVGVPVAIYPIAFWAALLGVLAVGWRERRGAGELDPERARTSPTAPVDAAA
jgi:alpha-1,2-mannosyltransferase